MYICVIDVGSIEG